MKTGDLLATAIANTLRAKLRTALTVIAIFIGAFTLTLTSAIGTGVSAYINTQVASLGSTNTMTVTKAATAADAAGSGPKRWSSSSATTTGSGTGRPGAATTAVLSASDVTKIGTIDGVESVTKNQAINTSWIEYGTHGKWDLSVSANRFGSADLAAGAQLSDSSSAYQLLLPTTYLSNVGLGTARKAVGDTVSIGIQDYAGVMHTAQATVVGVQNATLFSSAASVNEALRTKLTDLQHTGTPSTIKTSYGSVTITYASGASAHDLRELKSRLTAAGYTGQTIADQLGSVLTVTNGIVGVLDAFAFIALLAAGFGIVNTLLMSVQERTREIGLMKAMGMGSGRVFALFSFEAVFIGFLGSAIGAGVAIGLGSLASRALSRTLLSNLPGLNILQFSAGSVATIVLVVMAISFVSGTLPARRAAVQNPIDALRYE